MKAVGAVAVTGSGSVGVEWAAGSHWMHFGAFSSNSPRFSMMARAEHSRSHSSRSCLRKAAERSLRACIDTSCDVAWCADW